MKAFAVEGKSFHGTSIISDSGCDALELAKLLKTGSLRIDEPIRTNRSSFLLEGPQTNCNECMGQCMAEFTGNLVVEIGSNNALKGFLNIIYYT